MRKIFTAILFTSLLLIISSCDRGIEPEPEKPFSDEKTGVSGTVKFIGNWPEGIKRTHLVIFREEIKTSTDFVPPNLSFVADSIPFKSTEFVFDSNKNNFLPILQLTPGVYKYVAVAQSKTDEISLDRRDWFIAGVFYLQGDNSKPASIVLEEGKVLKNINIIVDFKNPPPQPPME